MMKKMIIAIGVLTAVSTSSVLTLAQEHAAPFSGEELFKKNCLPCHVNGGNIMNPKKTLFKKDREANNVNTAEDIINKMRNPGPAPTHPSEAFGMTIFDDKKISDSDARKIAEYIMETFR